MKKIVKTLLIAIVIVSCKVKEQPIFVKVANIKLVKSNAKVIQLSADAYFKNPNNIGGTLASEGIKVLVNGTEMATVSSQPFKVPAKKEFSIPLEVEIPTNKVFNNNNLSAILGSLLNKKLKVQYKGKLKYKVLGFSSTYNIDQIEEVKIKL